MAFVAERNELLEQQKKKWDERMQHRRDKEIEYMKNREKRVEDYENQLQHLRVQDAEEYNMVKIRLETDVQVSYIGHTKSLRTCVKCTQSPLAWSKSDPGSDTFYNLIILLAD